jgi:hypothetical protein
MLEGGGNLPLELEGQAGAMISELREAGWAISASFHDADCFGNRYVDLCRAGLRIRLVNDRSQHFIHGPTEEIKAAGIWRAFGSLEEFRQAIVKWATNLHQ